MKTQYHYLECFLILYLFFAGGCGGKDDKKADFSELNKVIPVSVSTVQQRDIANERTYGGNLEGVKQANIVAKISERIISVNVKVGQFVKAGQVIVELEKTGLTSQFPQAQANLENTKRELDRMTALYKEGAVAKQAVDQAQTAYSVAQANYEAARGAVELTAPISGTVTEVNINPGDWVNPGTIIAVVAEINQLIVKFNVSESEIPVLKMGTNIRVYSEFNKDVAQTGRITEINRSASLDSRSFGIKAQFSNTKDSFYKPGMFVKVNVVTEKHQNVLTIPTEAITREKNSNIVYMIKNGISLPVNIKPGFSNDQMTEVTSGLSAGDTIVTAGINNLSDSTRVKIVSSK
jgi:membrane fusion protein (multidrug efflux system)